jgi:DNA-binding response OmpR family regulator
MITGWGMEVNQTKIEESGLDFVISKPFDLNEILNIVAETLESKKDIPESFASHHPSLLPSPL